MSIASKGRWRRGLRAERMAMAEAKRAGDAAGLYTMPEAPKPRIYSGRWWVGWYTHATEFRANGFREWMTGQTMHKRQWFTMTGDVFATTADEAHAIVRRCYPDAVFRWSAIEKPRDKSLGDRFE